MAFVSTQAISASKTINSIGVNTHMDSFLHGYENVATTINAINYLGIKNLRDSPNSSVDVGPNGLWQKIHDGTGAMFDAYMNRGTIQSNINGLERAKQLAAQGIINFLEGTNESDTKPALDAGMTIEWAKNFQTTVYQTGKALGIPVINMSFGAGWTYLDGWQGNYDSVGDLSAVTDYGNAHTYPGAGQYTDTVMERINTLAKLAAKSDPVITTEIGWDMNKFSTIDVARFSLQAVLDGMENGNVKTYFYSLYDSGAGKFGLMNPDGTPKAAGTAIHNLTTILADSGTPKNESLTFELTGTTANDHKLLMQKSTGVFELALWNEKDAAHTVTLNLASTAQTVRVYAPLTGSTPIATYSNTSSISLTIPNAAVIVEIVPAPAVTLPPPSTAPVIYAKSDEDIYIQDGTHSVYLLGNDGSVVAADGANTMYTNGTRNLLSGGLGVDKISAFVGGNTLKGGGGDDHIRFGGSGNVVHTGQGNDTLYDSGSNNRIVFDKAGNGVTQIYGYVLKNGDTLDLRTTLANTSWNGTASTLGNYIQMGLSGNNAVVSINPTGVAGATTHQLAVLRDSGSVSLSTLLAHSIAA